MKPRLFPVVLAAVLMGFSLLATTPARAERATEQEMMQVCENWLTYMVYERGSWAGDIAPTIVEVQEIMMGDTLIARSYSIDPNGFVVVPVLKELPPVKAYSELWGYDAGEDAGIPLLLKDVLTLRSRLYVETYGDLDATQPPTGEVLLGREHREAWDHYLVEPGEFERQLANGALETLLGLGPLMSTNWHQRDPYNNYCPSGDGGRCLVGCVATAAAQIMRYHSYPPSGTGSRSYTWGGDQSCGGDVGGGTLSATFSDPYDWGNMPNSCGCNDAQKAALAELCYEVGVAFGMDYGKCGSGAYTGYATTVFPTYFKYHPSIDKEDRWRHSAAAWFDLIKAQINAYRPMQYRITGHSIVCDGWRVTTKANQYHINYGWGGSKTAWYTIDTIYGSPDPINDEYMVRNIIPNLDPVARCKDVTVYADANCKANASINNASYDPNGDAITLVQDPAGPYSLGRTRVKLTVTDSKGFSDDCYAYVTVADNTDPAITCPEAITVECSGACGTPSDDPQLVAFYAAATGSDNCDASVAITHNSPDCFPLGATTTVTFTATDDAGNTKTCQADVTVVDTTPPAITCPDEITVECSGYCGTPSDDIQLDAFWAGFTATDVCCLVSAVDDRPTCFDFGSTTVTFTATDCVGLQSICTADVVVVDTTPPVITCPADITVACNGPQGTFANDPQLDEFWAGVSATDVCDPDPVITHDGQEFFPIGTTPVAFRATDDHGNESVCVATVRVVDQGIDVWLDDLTVNPGEDILVPVYIQDATGWDLMAFEMEICWCDIPAGLLQYQYCLPGEVMAGSGWTDPICNICDPSCVSIAAAGAMPLTGGGVLFYLKFHVSANAKPCMCCDLDFRRVAIYDPETPLFACWENGSVCVEYCDVAGCINYWKCCPDGCGGYEYVRPLEGVQVHLWESCGAYDVATMFTGVDGCYEFTCLDPLGQDCYYAVNVDYCRIPDCINPFDASLILRYMACQEYLDDCPFPYNGGVVYPQQVAADVTCSSGITSYDASVLLQYFVGLIPAFPCFDPWVFYPLGANGNLVYDCPGTVNWIGVMLGDVNGCLECEFSPAPLGDPVQVALGSATDLGDRIEVPIVVQGAYDIFSGHFNLVYDAADLYVISAVPAGLAEGSMSAHNDMGGSMMLAMAAGEAFGGDGELAIVTFGKMSPGAGINSVALTEAAFNDGEPPAEIGIAAGVPAQTGQTALGRAVPNPFAQGTAISYHMASPGRVSLEIYNVEGQLVRTLVTGGVDAGPHSIMWNGKDNSGAAAARGVYFCCMEAEGYRATEKIVFMK